MNPVEMYKEAVKRVPAYRTFLREKTGAIPEVNCMEDFQQPTLSSCSISTYPQIHSPNSKCSPTQPVC